MSSAERRSAAHVSLLQKHTHTHTQKKKTNCVQRNSQMRFREGYFGSEGGESSQGTRGFHSHLVTARCQSSRHSRIPSKLVPWEGPARVRSRRIGCGAGGWSPRHSRIPLTSCLGGTGGVRSWCIERRTRRRLSRHSRIPQGSCLGRDR